MPGYEVDSLIINELLVTLSLIELQADSMNERSGSRLSLRGVGTAKMMISQSATFS